MGAFANIK